MANKELQTKWIEALSSGKYKQGIGKLKVEEKGEEKFCCLGVLCDLKNLGWAESISTKKVFSTLGHGGYQNTSFLPGTLRDEIGLTYHQTDALMNMNDKGASFEEISKEIEKMFEQNERENNARTSK